MLGGRRRWAEQPPGAGDGCGRELLKRANKVFVCKMAFFFSTAIPLQVLLLSALCGRLGPRALCLFFGDSAI